MVARAAFGLRLRRLRVRARLVDELAQLPDPTVRDEHLERRGGPHVAERDLRLAEAVPVRRDHPGHPPVRLEERAREVRPRVVARHRVRRERDELGEHAGVDLAPRGPALASVGVGKRREVRSVKGGQLEVRAARFDVERAVLQRELDRAVGRASHDVEERRRHVRRGEDALDRGLRGRARAEVEVGRGRAKLVAGGVEEDASEDGHRRAAFVGDGVRACDDAQEVGSLDGEVHASPPSVERSSCFGGD